MDFRELLDQYRVPYHDGDKKTRTGWINFRCPFCSRDPYMGYHISGRYVSCWSCGKHPLWETVQLLTHLPIKAVWDLVGSLPVERVLKDLEKKGTLVYPPGIGGLTLHHTAYLIKRNYDPLVIRKLWGVRAICGIGRYRWRLFIPVHLRGEVVSWTTRTIQKDREPRYLSAKDEESAVPIESLLYGIDYVVNSCVLVEGPLDAWAIGPGAVAIMGLRVSPAQLEQISRVPNRSICFDNEPKAQERARKLMNDLCVFPGVTKNILLSSKDPGSAPEVELELVRKELGIWKC